MSDIVRMLRVSESDPVQQEAADEIKRLRAELAAVSKERDIAWRDKLKLMHERDALRELLRDAQEYLYDTCGSTIIIARIDALLNKGDGDE